MIIEILTIIWQAFSATALGLIQAAISLWPALSQLSDMVAIFSPAGTLLVLLGVPFAVIPIGVKLIGYLIKAVKA